MRNNFNKLESMGYHVEKTSDGVEIYPKNPVEIKHPIFDELEPMYRYDIFDRISSYQIMQTILMQ